MDLVGGDGFKLFHFLEKIEKMNAIYNKYKTIGFLQFCSEGGSQEA